MVRMTFSDDGTLAAWLETTPRGHAIIRDVLLGKYGEQFWPACLERLAVDRNGNTMIIMSQPTLALVEVDPPTIRVYGEKHLRPLIVERPMVDGAAAEILAEECTGNAMPEVFRRVYWPGMVRRTATMRGERVRELSERIAETRMNVAIIKALNGMVTT